MTELEQIQESSLEAAELVRNIFNTAMLRRKRFGLLTWAGMDSILMVNVLLQQASVWNILEILQHMVLEL